ncbi:MAG: hypothetical protein WCE79_15105 [Xanthobacteraceae bacterium]
MDAADTIASLKVWRDFNEDGVTQAGELTSLADSGIASISVTGTPQQEVFEEGNQITATSSFTRTDGTTGTIVSLRAANDDAELLRAA